MYAYLLSVHIIFVICWFAGLFYLVRLFIYHTEALDKEVMEKRILTSQFKIMEKRLWLGITNPAMIGTLIFGIWLVFETGYSLSSNWLILKISFVVLLLVYHFFCGKILQQLKENKPYYSSNQLRIINEIATILLVAIVFIVVFKDTFSFILGIAGLLIFATILIAGIKIYKRIRKN